VNPGVPGAPGAPAAPRYTFGVALLTYVLSVVNYSDMLCAVRQQMGNDGLQEVLDAHDQSHAAADVAARHDFFTAFQHLPRGQQCSLDARYRLTEHLNAQALRA